MTQLQEKQELTKDNFALVPPEMMSALWAHIQPLLLQHGEEFFETYSLEEVFRQLCHGTMDIWVAGEDGVMDGLVLCVWERHDKASFYHIVFCCGSNLKKYFSYGLKILEYFACMKGAKSIVLEGRRGWIKLLGKRGYAPGSVRLKKPVSTLWSN